MKRVESALDTVLSLGNDYVDASVAEEAVAAADIVARLRGQFGQRDAYTEKIDEWVGKVKLTAPEAVVEKARRVVARITTPPSEMVELWEEAGTADDWRAATDALLRRLQ